MVFRKQIGNKLQALINMIITQKQHDHEQIDQLGTSSGMGSGQEAIPTDSGQVAGRKRVLTLGGKKS
nr:hypothetical protein [Tanacetum cinerariifolium]